MASFRGHLAFASSLGFVYGGLGTNQVGLDAPTAFLGAIITTVGGLLPDLDSDSGVPVRELFGLASAFVPLMLVPRLTNSNFSSQEIFLYLAILYIIIRYGLSRIFKRLSVHRGMFHSIPAMIIAGEIFFLCYEDGSLRTRIYLSTAVMLGFLSHLILDEIYSVDFRGLTLKLNKYAGSAVKFFSESLWANFVTYTLLFTLSYFVYVDWLAHIRP